MLRVGVRLASKLFLQEKPHNKQSTVAELFKMAGQMAANALEKVSETFSFAKKVSLSVK